MATTNEIQVAELALAAAQRENEAAQAAYQTAAEAVAVAYDELITLPHGGPVPHHVAYRQAWAAWDQARQARRAAADRVALTGLAILGAENALWALTGAR